jgi:ERF superfamily
MTSSNDLSLTQELVYMCYGIMNNGQVFSCRNIHQSIIVTTMLIHESGEFLESEPLILPAHQARRGGGKEFNAQGAGSAITYARRYSLSAMLGIASESDDDGNGASQKGNNRQGKNKQQNNNNGKASEKQLKMIHAKIAHISALTKTEKQTIEDTLKGNIGTDNLEDVVGSFDYKAKSTAEQFLAS